MPRYLAWEHEEASFFSKYSINLPDTEEEKASFRGELETEIRAAGFLSDRLARAFVKGGFWCEIITFTLQLSPQKEYILPIDYFMCFIYDCRGTSYSAQSGKLVICGVFKSLGDASVSAEQSINSLLEEDGI